jgi:ribosomal protein S6--L-glutamate ligase/tetrahydromethanopterin:alpha-L-glutamate ligase
MMNKAILVIGDLNVNRKKINPSFKEFIEHAQKLKERNKFELQVVNYGQLFSGKVPAIKAAVIKIVSFFPYTYWNRNIEIYSDGRVYGDNSFGAEFKIFFKRVKQIIAMCYHDKNIEYLNPPESCCLDRDKKLSYRLLSKSGIPIPRLFRVFSFQDIEKLLDKGIDLYIKPRFGALGKGITYIDREKVISNFLFRKGKIISRPYDYNWRFVRIGDKRNFVNALLRKGFICEEAIRPATFRKKRFDFRIYVIFGKVVYLYAKSAPISSCVTNWSQGGKIDREKKILRTLSKERILLLKRLAKRTAAVLGLDFAGIDIIFSQNFQDAYVLEANAFPGYEKGFDLMKCLLNSLVK